MNGGKPRVSRRQLVANRRNATKGGPKTPEGKKKSSRNARKHGIFVEALTNDDREELSDLHERFAEDLQPTGSVEETLVEKLAVCYLRLQRCARAEAEYHHATWTPVPPKKRRRCLNPGSYFKSGPFSRIVKLVQRYDTSITNQFLRVLHELERLQRIRRGDNVSPPVTADVHVTGS